jgi:glycosyltransferase involved in cell wall biosynthesis
MNNKPINILIFHNLLWSQYKSVIFEKLTESLNIHQNSKLLVIQTAITENSRKDLVDFDLTNFKFKYDYKLISQEPLESVSSFKVFYYQLYHIFKFKPNVINFTGYNEKGIVFLLLICKWLKIKSIITNESVAVNKLNSNKLLLKLKFWYKVLLFKIADGFFSYGINSNIFLFKHYVPKNKIFSFLNTFDKTKFNNSIKNEIAVDKPYILYVGRLSSEKNLLALVNLFGHIQTRFDKFKLIIIGNGPDRELLNKYITEKSLNKNVLLRGSVQWDKLRQYYKNAECLILPSLYEPWGMVVNESQEAETPIIVTSMCGCANDLVINDYNGIVCDDITSQKNINKIMEFLAQSPLYKKRIQQFLSKNKQIFDLERLNMELMRGFVEIVQKNRI